MSGVSSTTPGTNTPPVSFPGIASGIDYNSIISKMTALSLQPAVSLSQHVATLNSQNAELIKINGLLASVQNSITALSQGELYTAISATSSNTTALTASGIPNVYAAPGVYTIDATSLATATVVSGAANIGHVMTDAMPGTTTSGANVPLVDSWASVTPSNGGLGSGSITINGVTVAYDVTTQSLNTILANINSAEHAAGDTGFNIALNGNSVTVTDSSRPISLGAQGDTGNLLQVLHLDSAQVSNTASSGSATSTAGIGGVNQGLAFNSTNALGQTTNANYLTPVTSGTFTINGVQIAVSASGDNLASVLKKINASAAGVIAALNPVTNQITLTSKTTGAQSIVIGSSSDTSNFLTATGLNAASGATQTIGKQASVTIETPTGAQTIYSNSNSVTTAIPGVQLNLLANTSTPFQVTVGADSTHLVSALNTFVSAYNAAINEINSATAPPVVASAQPGSSTVGTPSAPVGAGILYNNADVQSIKDQLVQMVTALNSSTGSPTYNSLSTIGLNITSSFTQLVQNTNTSSSSSGQISAKTMAGTDGALQALDVSKLQAAFAANPSAVQTLINGKTGLVQQMGAYLTGVTGVPTSTATGLLGNIPSVSLIQTFENDNTANIQSIQQQITQIQTNVNMQADALRQQFVAAEAQIAQLQSLQSQISGLFKSGG